MKLQLALIVAFGLVAAPASAQGTFSGPKPASGFGSAGVQRKPAAPSYGVPAPPSYGAAPHRAPASGYAPIVTPPSAPVAKPFEPYKPPRYGPKPSRPCETSVFVDACDR